MRIDIVEICFTFANGQISSIICPSSVSRTSSVVSFLDVNSSKYQRIFTKLGMCIDIYRDLHYENMPIQIY